TATGATPPSPPPCWPPKNTGPNACTKPVAPSTTSAPKPSEPRWVSNGRVHQHPARPHPLGGARLLSDSHVEGEPIPPENHEGQIPAGNRSLAVWDETLRLQSRQPLLRLTRLQHR